MPVPCIAAWNGCQMIPDRSRRTLHTVSTRSFCPLGSDHLDFPTPSRHIQEREAQCPRQQASGANATRSPCPHDFDAVRPKQGVHGFDRWRKTLRYSGTVRKSRCMDSRLHGRTETDRGSKDLTFEDANATVTLSQVIARFEVGLL